LPEARLWTLDGFTSCRTIQSTDGLQEGLQSREGCRFTEVRRLNLLVLNHLIFQNIGTRRTNMALEMPLLGIPARLEHGGFAKSQLCRAASRGRRLPGLTSRVPCLSRRLVGPLTSRRNSSACSAGTRRTHSCSPAPCLTHRHPFGSSGPSRRPGPVAGSRRARGCAAGP
jgi:hypothetical protein